MPNRQATRQSGPGIPLDRREFLTLASAAAAAPVAQRLSPADDSSFATTRAKEPETGVSSNYLKGTRRLGPDWNLLPFDEMHVDRIDPATYVKHFADANVNCIFQYVKGCWGYSIYNTNVGIKHPHLKADLLKGIIDHAHASNVMVQAYYCLCFDNAILRKHPEWRMVDTGGKPITVKLERRGIPGSGWHRACFNTPYRQYALDQVTEIARDYDVDMMWLDILNQGEATDPGCYCKACREAYRKRFGRDIPTDANWDRAWKQHVKWRLDVIEEFWKDIVATIHKYKPGIPVCRNYQVGRSRVHRSRLVEGERFLHGEDGQPESVNRSQVASFLRGLSGGKAFHYSINSCWQPEVGLYPSYERFRAEAIGNLAHGAVSTMAAGVEAYYPDKKLGHEGFNRVAPAFEEHAQKEKYVHGAVTIPYIGTTFTDATWMFYAQDDFPGRFDRSLHGATDVLLKLRLPFNVIAEWDINPENLKAHKVLLLPNVAAMSPAQAQVLKAYVSEGGCLLGTYETSLYDEEGNQLEDFQLGELFGLKYLGTSWPDPDVVQALPESFISPNGHDLFRDLPNGPLALSGPYVRTKPISGETIVYQSDAALVTYEGKKALWGRLPGEESRYPAVHLNRYGKGKALFITSELFKQCFPNGINAGRSGIYVSHPQLWWSRRLVKNAIRVLDQAPPIWVEGADTVEATFWRKPEEKQVVVQLLNTTHRDAVIPIEDITIKLATRVFQPKEAYLPWPSKKALAMERRGNLTEVAVPKIGLHEIIILQC